MWTAALSRMLMLWRTFAGKLPQISLRARQPMAMYAPPLHSITCYDLLSSVVGGMMSQQICPGMRGCKNSCVYYYSAELL
jgi:hypothetical protein